MNSRIKLISDTEVEVQRNRHSGLVSLFVHNGTTLLVNHNHFNGNLEIDAEGNDAELEVRQCWKDTGSFAALADTSAVPYKGKRMRDGKGDVVTLVLAAGSNGWWHSETEGALGVLATKEYLPLTPPVKKYRPLTPVEALQHFGRKILSKNHKNHPKESHYLYSVYPEGVYWDSCRMASFEMLLEHYVWADTKEPCGVEEV